MGSYSQSYNQSAQHSVVLPELEQVEAFASPDSLATAQGSMGANFEGSSNNRLNQTIQGHTGAEVNQLVSSIMDRDSAGVDAISGLAESNFDTVARLAESNIDSFADVAGEILNSQNMTAEIFAGVTDSIINNKENSNEIMAGFARDVTGQLAANTMSETGQFSKMLKEFGVFIIVIIGIAVFWSKKK